MFLNFLGRGSAFNVKEGNTSAYVKKGGAILIVDCGSTVFSKIMEEHLLDDVYEVNIIITHRHPDHVGSLGDLIFYCYYEKDIIPNIYTPDLDICNYLFYCGVLGDKYNWIPNKESKIKSMNFDIDFSEVEHVSIFKMPSGEITNRSYNPNLKNCFRCYGFLLIDNDTGTSVAYTGDCKDIRSFPLYTCVIDELYVDCCYKSYKNNPHININDLKDFLSEYRICYNNIYCMHLDCDECIDECKKYNICVVELEK